MSTRPNGVVLWESDSVVAIATGLRSRSANRKTGAMVQTWILAKGEDPVRAIRSGLDSVVCGDCPLRGNHGAQRACYVNVGQAPRAVYYAWKRGAYSTAWDSETFRGRAVRLGAYGDPAMVPVEVWQRVLCFAKNWTGYTHQWRNAPALRRYCMASVDTAQDRRDATRLGWRYFGLATEPEEGAIWCPATPEGGSKAKCETCGLCKGASLKARNVIVAPHGSGAKYVRIGG